LKVLEKVGKFRQEVGKIGKSGSAAFRTASSVLT
jgi:hypothetical protein